jgi:hypothetical protein
MRALSGGPASKETPSLRPYGQLLRIYEAWSASYEKTALSAAGGASTMRQKFARHVDAGQAATSLDIQPSQSHGERLPVFLIAERLRDGHR